MSADDKDLNTTPFTVTKPWDGLCVTCAHHSYAYRPFMSGHEAHGAQFLTCRKRSVRSVVNGETSHWCGDIRADGAACALWENDRSCQRCVHARPAKFLTPMQCHHPSRMHTYGDDCEYESLRGKTFGVDCWPRDPNWEHGDLPKSICGGKDWEERK